MFSYRNVSIGNNHHAYSELRTTSLADMYVFKEVNPQVNSNPVQTEMPQKKNETGNLHVDRAENPSLWTSSIQRLANTRSRSRSLNFML